MSQSQQGSLTQKQMRAIFKRNYGAANKLAVELKVHRSHVSMCLRGFPVSKDIQAAIRARAAELLEAERRAA